MRWCSVLLALALGACASDDGRSPEVRRADWEAQNVYPVNYRAEILAYLRTYLNDPTGIHDAAIAEPVLKPAGFGNRYVVCMRFNAKKPSGGYAGSQEHFATFVSGKLDKVAEVKSGQCAGAVYGPFGDLERLTR